jgi:hypothetical protein
VKTIDEVYVELDCPWWNDEWLRDHPDFPLAPGLFLDNQSAPKPSSTLQLQGTRS